jgi:hypothetical protein
VSRRLAPLHQLQAGGASPAAYQKLARAVSPA